MLAVHGCPQKLTGLTKIGLSKTILYPSLRLGFLVAPSKLVDTLVKVRCENEEHTERGINANDHERVVRVACVPRPTRRPGDHQRVNAENKNYADEDENDA